MTIATLKDPLHWSAPRGVDAVISTLFGFTLVFLVASNTSELAPDGLLVGGLFSVAMAGLAYFTLRAGALIPALLVMISGLAYSPGAAEAASSGSYVVGAYASSNAVVAALGLLTMFLVVVCSTSIGLTRLLDSRRQPRQALASEDPSYLMALSVLLVASLVDALTSGLWTYYGAERVERTVGSFQLSHLYHPVLLSAFVLQLRSLMMTRDSGRRVRQYVIFAVLLGLAVLIFSTQMRRLMLVALLLGAIAFIRKESSERIQKGGFWLWFGQLAGVGALAVGLVLVGSDAWRASSAEFLTNNPAERFGAVSEKLADSTDIGEVTRKVSDRLTYLWLDAVSVESAEQLDGYLNLADVASSAMWNAVPGVLAPGKYGIRPETCESVMGVVGLKDIDLPCSPTSESYLAGGLGGVALVAILWGVYLCLVTALFRSNSALGIVAAVHLAWPLLLVETSAFPMFLGIRTTVLSTIMIGLLALPIRLLMVRAAAIRA